MFGPGDGHIKKPDQPLPGFVRGDDPVNPNQINQVEVQSLGAVDADQGDPVGGDIKKLFSPNILGDPVNRYAR